MEKNEFRVVIKHLHQLNEFKRSHTFTCDAPRSGCPIEAATPQIIDKVHDIVLTDRRVKVGISYGTVISILHEQLGMKKLSARWVQRLLTVDRSEEGEDREVDRKGDGHSFLGCTRYNSYRLSSVEANYQWRLGEEESALPSSQCMGSFGTKFNEFRYELLSHPAYLPDLAPYNYFLFPNLKKWLGGRRFATREQLKTEAYFESLDKSYYSNFLKKLENSWIKCIELKGDYIEK
ncbi:SETMR methyltransferase, partial [Acromyrmex charruanus]